MRERDAPRRAGPADREVLEALADEAQHLVAPVVGLDEAGVRLVVGEQPLLVRRQAEEPVALGQPLERHARVVGALHPGRGLVEVGRGLEPLRRAVPALVRAEVDVAVVVRPADHLLGRPVVVRIGGPDEPVGADQQRVLGRLEQLDLLVDEVARRPAEGLGGLGDVDAVLVGAGQEPRVVAAQPVPPRDDVSADDLVHRVEAGRVVRVRDGGRDVEALAVGHGPAMVAAASGAFSRSGRAAGPRDGASRGPSRPTRAATPGPRTAAPSTWSRG